MTTRVKESETTREEEVNVHLALALSRRGYFGQSGAPQSAGRARRARRVA